MTKFRHLTLFLITILIQGSLSLHGSEATHSKQEKIEQLMREMWAKEKEILDLLREGDLSDNVSSFEQIFKIDVPDVRSSTISILMSRISDGNIDVGANEEIAELLKSITESKNSYPYYKLWLAEICFVKKPVGFDEPEQSLSNQTFLYHTISEELKNKYITQQVSMVRYLYVNRWVNRKLKESKSKESVSSQ